MSVENGTPGESHQRAIARFTDDRAATKYPAHFKEKARDRREQNRILAALGEVQIGARLLDLPCGTVRSHLHFARKALRSALQSVPGVPEMMRAAQ